MTLVDIIKRNNKVGIGTILASLIFIIPAIWYMPVGNNGMVLFDLYEVKWALFIAIFFILFYINVVNNRLWNAVENEEIIARHIDDLTKTCIDLQKRIDELEKNAR